MQTSTFKAFNGKLQKPINLFAYFRIRKMIRKWRKRAKNSKHRHYVLQEWISTEKTHIKDLKIIQEEIRRPIVSSKPPLITKEQQMTMFANVDVIIMLSNNLYEQLDKLEKKWNPLTTQIGPVLISLHAFFKIYLEYCNLFYKGQTVLKQIKNQPVVVQIQKKLPLDIASYLIKPVQRPPKYQLLLRDYLKHMPQTHIDYKNILLAVKKYHEVNETNNQAIARQARVERMFYLAKLYDELLSSTREFVNEFQATIFEEPVKLYALSDMLLITREVEGKQSLMKVILLDWTSFAKRNPDGKYFLNKVFICGKSQCANLSFVTDRSADIVVETIKNVIDKLYKKDEERRSLIANVSWKRPEVKIRVTLAERRIEQLSYQPRFRVNVEGVQKRPLSKFNDETFYVIKYELPRPWKMCQYVYTQFETIEEIEKIVRKKVPNINAIKLRSDSINMGTLEQTRNKTRIIEYRELIITQLLNYILRNDKIMANPLSLIEKLRIDENLWALAVDETRDKCTCSICLHDMTAGQLSLNTYMDRRWNHYVMKHSQLTSQDYCIKKYLIDKMNLLKLPIQQFNSLDRMLLYLEMLQGRMDYSLIYKQIKPDTFSVKVWFQNVSYKEFIEIKINKETRVGEVMTLIGRDFGMQFMNDFGLFVSYSDRPRLIDSDEILYEVMRQTESEVDNINSKGFFWEGITNVKKWGQQVIKGKKSRLYIRKYFYLPRQFETASWHGCFQRQLLVLQQTLYDIKTGYLQLSDDELSRMAASFVCLKELDRIAHVKSSNFPLQRVKQIIPSNRLELLNNNSWIKSIVDLFEKKKLAIASMKEKVQILCDDMLNIAQEKPLWSTYIVEAENYDPSTLKGNRPFIILGVNPRSFSVYSEGYTTELLSIPLLQLNYKVTVFSIFITHDEKSYRFDAPMLFNFSRIIEKYKLLNKLIAHGG